MNLVPMRRRSFTLDPAAGDLADDNGIKTSIATAATQQTYTSFNGSSTVGKTGMQFASWPTVKASSATASYVAGSSIVFTGTYQGATKQRTALLTSADGGETVVADGPLDHGSITSIVVAAQVDTAGALEFGWKDIAPKLAGYSTTGVGSKGLVLQDPEGTWILVARAAGNVHVGMDGGVDETLALPIHGIHYAYVTRVYSDTAVLITIYE